VNFFLTANRGTQCLLRPGWMLADYSIQLDWHSPKTVFNLGILYTSLLADRSAAGRLVYITHYCTIYMTTYQFKMHS